MSRGVDWTPYIVVRNRDLRLTECPAAGCSVDLLEHTPAIHIGTHDPSDFPGFDDYDDRRDQDPSSDQDLDATATEAVTA